KIWEKLETEGLAFVRSLGKKLNEKDCKSLFPDSEFSMRKHILEDIETAPFHVHGRESIDALILEFKDKLDFEAAGRLSQYQDSESLKYLFSNYSSNPDLTDFLMHLYGECVYRHPEILEDNSLLEFYEKYMIDYWGVFLPPKPSCLELTVPLVRYARTEDSMGMDAYDYETINVNEIVISKANIRKCDLQPIDSVSGIFEAVSDWLNKSNGEVIARHCRVVNASDSETIVHSLISTEKQLVGSLDKIKVKMTNASDAFNALFHAASGGGCAYCTMGNSLDARAKAWKSFSSMMHLELDRGLDISNEATSNWSWYFIKPDTEWFANIMDEVWLVSVNNKLDKASMLAASDVD
ncbi:MAG: DUF6183 family protein, partial [Candidatus Thiodiazotropha sp. 6PLUC3]